jgi:hypothetical protein
VRRERKLGHRSKYCSRSYFRSSDFPEPRILKIDEIRAEELPNQSNQGGGRKKPKLDLVAYFEYEDMGLVLNQANQDILEALSGSPYPDDWVGLTVELYCAYGIRNPNGGGTTTGLRLRQPTQPAQETETAAVAKSLDDAELAAEFAD